MPPRKKKILTETPKAQIVSSLRLLWMRSVERSLALKRDKNTCSCGAKGSVAKGMEVKMEVHHTIGTDGHDINWDKIVEVIREELLCHPDYLISLCKPCHYSLHGRKLPKERKKK